MCAVAAAQLEPFSAAGNFAAENNERAPLVRLCVGALLGSDNGVVKWSTWFSIRNLLFV